MMYLPEANLVYIAVPKTGGVSAANALRPYADPSTIYDTNDVNSMHTTSSFARRLYPKSDIVCVVREPVDWLFSKYKYTSGPYFSWDSVYTTRHQTFSRFVKRYLKGEKPWPEPHRMQVDYAQEANFIFKYENLSGFTNFLSKRLGQTIVLPTLNVSPQKSFDVPEDQILEVKSFLKDDYTLWNSALPEGITRNDI